MHLNKNITLGLLCTCLIFVIGHSQPAGAQVGLGYGSRAVVGTAVCGADGIELTATVQNTSADFTADIDLTVDGVMEMVENVAPGQSGVITISLPQRTSLPATYGSGWVYLYNPAAEADNDVVELEVAFEALDCGLATTTTSTATTTTTAAVTSTTQVLATTTTTTIPVEIIDAVTTIAVPTTTLTPSTTVPVRLVAPSAVSTDKLAATGSTGGALAIIAGGIFLTGIGILIIRRPQRG